MLVAIDDLNVFQNASLLPDLKCNTIHDAIELIRNSIPKFEIGRGEPLVKLLKVSLSNEFMYVLHVNHILIDDISLQIIRHFIKDELNDKKRVRYK